jgi:hypothetical protein
MLEIIETAPRKCRIVTEATFRQVGIKPEASGIFQIQNKITSPPDYSTTWKIPWDLLDE